MAESHRIGEGLGHLNVVHGSLTEGWRYSDADAEISLLTDTEIFGFVKQRRAPPRKAINREAFLAELVPGRTSCTSTTASPGSSGWCT